NVDPEHPSPHEVKIFVDDPVGKSAFVLDPASKSADKFFDERNVEGNGPRIMIKSDIQEGGPVASRRMLIKFRDEHSADSNTSLAPIQEEKRDVAKEDLGTRNIEGIDCNGTRTTTTIPAGAIGNEKPIIIVRETWFAPAIAALVEST